MIFIHKLFDPVVLFGFFLLLVFIVSIYYKSNIKKASFTLFVYFLITSPLISNTLIHTLERDNVDTDLCFSGGDVNVIVVLAGGIRSGINNVNPVELLSYDSIVRTIGANYLHQKYPSSQMIIAGGYLDKYSESTLMKMLLMEFGVEERLIATDDKSTNTYENAKQVGELLGELSLGNEIVLVTSAYHMRRSSEVFEMQGMDVCQFSVDYRRMDSRLEYSWIPHMRSLYVLKNYLHEQVGYLYYMFKGYV